MRTRSTTRWVLAAALAGLAASAGPAGAFYWYTHTDKTVISPKDKDKPGNPPGRPPVNPPGNPPPGNPPPGNPPPSPVPEPATALAALVGLGALGAARAWRRKHADASAKHGG